MNHPTHKIPSTSRPAKSREHFHDFPLVDADQCVKCGLCLPHCPTYKLSRHEGDSPRGRIALMQGLAQGVLEAEGSALPHLDGCLVCRACEPVCPAQVPYGRLIDAGRKGLWRAGHRPGWFWHLLAYWRQTPRRLRWLSLAVRFAHRAGLARIAALSGNHRVARAASYIQRSGKPPTAGNYMPAGESRGRIALFLGCVARPLDAPVLHATIRVLNAMGYAVTISDDQTCCGAMDAHAGDADTMKDLACTNRDAFAAADKIISTASGCGAHLQDYRELDIDGMNEFSVRVEDVMHFIAARVSQLPVLDEKNLHVAVHSPCTLKNAMRQSGALDVLRRIPGLDVRALRHKDCCGAAGTYLFEHVETADRLGNQLLDALNEDVPDFFVTSNTGCALHVRRLARKRGIDLQVLHPVELLAASLPHSTQRATRL